MRLSTAIILGSSTCLMKPGDWNSCALGCAANAVGMPQAIFNFDNRIIYKMPDGHSRREWILNEWPWLRNKDKTGGDFAVRIYMRFDYGVCDGNLTLEQLADFVKSVEPDCDCNRFNCDCKKTGKEVETCSLATV
jgi:hypothetical protein